MGTPTQIYVDPSIAADSGAGTVGDPYGDLQYALNTVTRDATNGDQFNIKAGTDEILTASLSLATYGTPTGPSPLILRGYTTSANDGGIGGISGNGSYGVLAVTNYVSFFDMHLHNCGSNTIVSIGYRGIVYNCEIDNSTGIGLQLQHHSYGINNHIHNIGNRGIYLTHDGATAMFNYLANGTNTFNYAINLIGSATKAIGNIIDIGGESDGIVLGADRQGLAMNNSVYSNGGTGIGVNISAEYSNAINNIVEGFSGVGGVGINIASSADAYIYGYNIAYNNTTNFSLSGDIFNDLSANDVTATESPFFDAANGDFRLKSEHKALGFPTANYPNLSVRSHLDPGALQRQEYSIRARTNLGLG